MTKPSKKALREATPARPLLMRASDRLAELVTPAQLATGAVRWIQDEAAEQTACDRLLASVGGDIVCFSQPRDTMQTLGIPDRRYRFRGCAFWWEVKAEDGALSVEQLAFLRAEHRAGELGGCGTAAELEAILTCRIVEWRALFIQSVDRWEAKGLRKALQPPKRRAGRQFPARSRRRQG